MSIFFRVPKKVNFWTYQCWTAFKQHMRVYLQVVRPQKFAHTRSIFESNTGHPWTSMHTHGCSWTFLDASIDAYGRPWTRPQPSPAVPRFLTKNEKDEIRPVFDWIRSKSVHGQPGKKKVKKLFQWVPKNRRNTRAGCYAGFSIAFQFHYNLGRGAFAFF